MNRYFFEKDDYVQHRYGGVYQFVGHATDTSTGQEVVVYAHVWPFDDKLFTRPSSEFYDGRFIRLTDLEFIELKKAYSTEQMQNSIKHNKANGLTFGKSV